MGRFTNFHELVKEQTRDHFQSGLGWAVLQGRRTTTSKPTSSAQDVLGSRSQEVRHSHRHRRNGGHRGVGATQANLHLMGKPGPKDGARPSLVEHFAASASAADCGAGPARWDSPATYPTGLFGIFSPGMYQAAEHLQAGTAGRGLGSRWEHGSAIVGWTDPYTDPSCSRGQRQH